MKQLHVTRLLITPAIELGFASWDYQAYRKTTYPGPLAYITRSINNHLTYSTHKFIHRLHSFEWNFKYSEQNDLIEQCTDLAS